MRRSQFLDMSSKLAVSSRGNLGDDKERQNWNLGRRLFKTILKYMFEGMCLTPGALLVTQHIMPWDPELVVACVEQRALQASDMPTVTYVATGWTPAHATISQHIETVMSDILSQLIETGMCSMPGFRTKCS